MTKGFREPLSGESVEIKVTPARLCRSFRVGDRVWMDEACTKIGTVTQVKAESLVVACVVDK